MKKKLPLILTILAVILIIVGCVVAYFVMTNSNGEQGNVQEEPISTEPIFTLENYPKIDGSTATIPLSNAFIKNFTGKDSSEMEGLTYNKTHGAYVNLIEGNADLILVVAPSEEELDLAKSKGVELEMVEIVKEGFVFFTNEKNTVNNLTLNQIQQIYAGNIKNWNEVGGNDAEIVAFQRPVNSGSQTGLLDLVMKDIEVMEPKKENIQESMSDIVNVVSDYDNGENSIGYSYYYYATTMYDTIDSDVADRIKLLGIDGVIPSFETIQNGSYPIKTSYYAVIRKDEPENSDARKLLNAMLSTRGQKVAKEAGYVSVK